MALVASVPARATFPPIQNTWRVLVMTQVIIDTGPLVALLDDTDHHHKWAVSQLSVLSGPLFTCDAVLAEACYLLKGYPRAFEQLADYFQKSALVCDFSS